MHMIEVSFELNGDPVSVTCEPDAVLVDVLREQLLLTGTKIGCREGECGACTIIMNSQSINSCLVPVAKAQGAVIETIESLASHDHLHPLQEAFINEGAVQCGFCTPGIIMASKALLDKNKSPDKEEIREAVGGNICRCTGYVKIERAINAAAHKMSIKAVKGETS